MAVYKIFPTQDATLYSAYSDMNTGVDAILEVSSTVPNTSPSPRVARSLIKFDQEEINDIITNKISGSNWSSNLKLFIAEAEGINTTTTLETYPIFGDWHNGSGQYQDSPVTTNGASWKYVQYSGSGIWLTGGYNNYITGSYSGSISEGVANGVGGNWYTGSSYTTNELVATQSFDLRSDKDFNTPVTNIVEAWYSSSALSVAGGIQTNGFIVKLDSSQEFTNNQNLQPQFKFYSVDTNTIYPPCLEFGWDDFTYETGSLNEINTEDIFVSIDNNPGTFRNESINEFRLNVRPTYPARTYQTSSLYTSNNILPTSSYYAIKDLDTNEFVINFDSNFTKISCDDKGNFFTIYMNGLEPERYYKILIKTEVNGNVIVKDDNYYFKVING